jgi:hypothetical protein
VGWLSDAKEAAMSRINESERSEVSVMLKWVYGINLHTFPVIQYLEFKESKDESKSRLIYSASSIVIIYNPHTHKQEHYLEHRVSFEVIIALDKLNSSFNKQTMDSLC